MTTPYLLQNLTIFVTYLPTYKATFKPVDKVISEEKKRILFLKIVSAMLKLKLSSIFKIT